MRMNRRVRHATTIALLGALTLATGAAQAAGVPGADFYIGGAVGNGRVTGADPAQSVADFKENHTAFKLFAGTRVAMFGAEVAYLNFGKAAGDIAGVSASGKLEGYGVFALVYAPLPLPVLDIYAKAGLARLSTEIRAAGLGLDRKNTDFGVGAGAQLKFGSWAIRAEYERFATDGTDPSLLSLGFTKSFL